MTSCNDISKIIEEMRKYRNTGPVIGFKDPYKVLISTVLSQRTKDQNTIIASKRLFFKFDTPQKVYRASISQIEELIKSSGFFKVKAQRIKRITEQIINDFNGEVPRSREELLTLEGVGPKTAGCVQVYGFGDDALPVDVHVHRIANRLGLVSTSTPEETEPALKKVVKKSDWKEINHLMVKYGQNICLPRNPNCAICELKMECKYFKKLAMKRGK